MQTYRLLAIGILLLAVGGTNVAYDTAEFRSYPESSAILSEPAAHDGEEVFLFADVKAVDKENDELTIVLEEVRITAVGLGGVTEEQTARHEITVRASETTTFRGIEPGAYVQVRGTLREDSTVLVADSVVVDYSPGDLTYIYATSVLGLLFAVGYFFRHWQINVQKLCFEPRGDE